MGFCRACLYALGAYAVSPELGGALVPAVLLWGYVVGLTHVARFENASVVGRTWPMLLLFLPTSFVVLVEWANRTMLEHPIPTNLVQTGAAVALSVGWALFALRTALKGGRAIGRAVVALIAGISLVDATFLAYFRFESMGALLFAFAAFALTLVLQRWVRGT
jgi:4-hydroxybenzoate polyprenyltransferase